MLDEPDNYVPLREIQPWLMTLVDVCEETSSKAIICSHHPEVIDYLGPTQGRILQRNAAGAMTALKVNLPSVGPALKLSELLARGWVVEVGCPRLSCFVSTRLSGVRLRPFPARLQHRDGCVKCHRCDFSGQLPIVFKPICPEGTCEVLATRYAGGLGAT